MRALFREPQGPSPLHLQAGQPAEPSAAPVQSHLAGWGIWAEKQRLKAHWGKISPHSLSLGRKNATVRAS